MESELKEKFLELLDKDKEFRYAVAAYLGLADILRRLDRFEEIQTKILEEIMKMRIEQNKLWENQNKTWEEIKGLRENQEKLWENQNKMWENQNRIWEEINKTWKEIKALREEQTKIWKEIRSINERIEAIQEEQRRLSITVERLTISVEEEARDVISYRLSKELGIEIKLDRLFINDREINIYGAVGDICVIGEASVRVGPRIVREIEEKIELIRKYKLELLKPKLIKVIYADVVPPKVLELASKNSIWVLSWKGDLLPMKIIQ
jgi:uncharacterized protein YoxC